MDYTEQQFDQAMTTLLEAKLQIHYWGATGQWFWSSRSDAESLDDWQGPFPSYFQALADAVEPYEESHLDFALNLMPGDEVVWNDPDEGLCTKTIKINTIEYLGGEIFRINGELECLAEELG